ncbi:right-handed parallel beta-helix repeat-containing protein [Dokdonella soli]|uniref:Right-handed parallel beta-helix repeat-containing protein n=1 Tax=Dokdonella soli TaxID=529810 RepID=A0ABP3TLU4_9GAMM
MNMSVALRTLLVGSFLFLGVGFAHAQATRTWVSGVGDDANPCSRTAPCKTFAGAISKTAPAGIIDVLDPGGFGALTITKSITLEAVGTVAGVLVSGTNGIVVAAGASDVVTLRGLSIEGLNTGLNGVRFISGAKLVIENTAIHGFTQNGVDIEPSADAQVLLHNVTVGGSGNGAVWVFPTAGVASVALDNVKLSNNKYGLFVVSGKASLKNSVVSANSSHGVSASSNGTLVRVNVDGSLISDNVGTGVRSIGASSAVYVSRSSITGNATGLNAASGSLNSYGNNRVFENTTNGAFTATLMEQ